MIRHKKRYTESRTSPRESRRACLCANGNTYSRKCCKGRMINQGIGRIYSDGQVNTVIKRPPRAFSEGFSNGFE
jgi:hypothetical protein